VPVVGVAGGEGYLRAGAGEGAGGLQADAGRGPGDDGTDAAEIDAGDDVISGARGVEAGRDEGKVRWHQGLLKTPMPVV
jgi:hypothetical protein